MVPQPVDLSFLEYPGVTVTGEVYDSMEPDFLLQDLVEVALPNGEIVDIGWYPEHDPTGQFRVMVFDDQSMTRSEEHFTRDLATALKIVERIIKDKVQRRTEASTTHRVPPVE
jgi:hypothetical protein